MGKHQKEIPRFRPHLQRPVTQMRSSVDHAENAFFAVPVRALSTTDELGQTPWNDGLLIITRVFVLNVPWRTGLSVGRRHSAWPRHASGSYTLAMQPKAVATATCRWDHNQW